MEIITLEEDNKNTLKKKAKRVASIDDSIRNICAAMVECMHKNNGVGLAATQVGILKRIIVVSDTVDTIVMINPEIVKSSEEVCEMNEGCLSIPHTFLDITRPKSVKVKYRDLKGKPHYTEYHDLFARVIQHEVDHLDGIIMNAK